MTAVRSEGRMAGASWSSLPLGWIRISTAKDHMNPRSSNRSQEGDSRRFPSIALSGRIIARDKAVTAARFALLR